MAWIKIDDQFRNHPKVLAAGPLASWLYVCSLTFAGQYLTDGHIPSTMLGMLAAVDNAQELADRLVDVGLWEEVEGGYQIHDFTEYNPTREEVRGVRAARAEAGRRGGLNSAASKRQANATANEQQNSTPSPSPSPSPIPIPAAAAPELRPEPNADPVVAHLFGLLDKAAVIVNGAMQAEAWTDLLDITRDKTLLSETFVEAARTGKHPSPNWCRSVLERCIRDNTRPGKWNGDGRARDEPAGKPYARDGPLRMILVEDSQGNITEETVG